jgi:uncharacterized protein (TIGR02118 family)
MYPASPAATFDFGYYMETHMPLVQRLWRDLGLQDARVLRGGPAPDGAAPIYLVMTLLSFASLEAFKDAAAQHGKEIFADIPNFTSAQPILQFNTTLN